MDYCQLNLLKHSIRVRLSFSAGPLELIIAYPDLQRRPLIGPLIIIYRYRFFTLKFVIKPRGQSPESLKSPSPSWIISRFK